MDRLAETLAIVGFYALVTLAVLALFWLVPWPLAVLAVIGCLLVMVRKVGA